jgi:predicted phosphodiesterase
MNSIIQPDIWDYSRSRFTAWVISDYHQIDANTMANKTAVEQMVNGNNPDIVLTAGDNSEVGTYAFAMAPWQDWINRKLVYPVPGNHDNQTPSGVPDYLMDYFAFFPYLKNNYYYQLSLGPIDFFMLHSDGKNPDGVTATSPQGQWFSKMLSLSTATWKAAIFHHPAYSSGNVHGSSPWMQWPDFAKLDFAISGHDHVFERLKVGNTYYFVDGMAGSPNYGFLVPPLPQSQFRYNSTHGAMRVDVSQNALSLEFVDVKGVVVDRTELRK